MVWNIIHRPSLSDVLDIVIVTFLVYQLLVFTRETRVSQVLKGLAVLLVSAWLSEIFQLRTLNWILRWVVNAGAVVLVVLFQPEIRRVLEGIGRTSVIRKLRGNEEAAQTDTIISEMVQAMLNMSKRRVGALIVIEQKTSLKEVCDTGTQVDACISQPLIENIFEPNTPLHDGAVILAYDRIRAAGCVLGLAEGAGISRELGTRHRAAIGISEATDAVALIVSEETGIISMARGGRLTRHMDARSLTALLQGIHAQPTRVGILSTIFAKRRRPGHESNGE